MILVELAKIKEFRKNSGYSQNELGRLAGVSEGTVSHIERTGRAREKTLKKIADALGVRVSDLVKPDQPPPAVGGVSSQPINYSSLSLFELTVARMKRAGLTAEEGEQLKRAITWLVDIFTLPDHIKRRQFVAGVEGIIKLCHISVFPQGGRERGLSNSGKGEK